MDEPPSDQRDDEPRALVVHASKFAGELLALPVRVRRDLGAIDEVLIILDATVMLCQVLTDDADTRPWAEKVESVFADFKHVGETYGDRIAEYITSLDQEAMEAMAKRYIRTDYLDFVQRAVGAAAFHRLHAAFTEDCDVVVSAVYEAVEGMLPYAVALSDVAGALTDDQISAIMDFNPAGGMMLEMALGVLEFLDTTVEKIALPEHLVEMAAPRERPSTPEDLLRLTDSLRTAVSGKSRETVAELSAMLERKLEGARQALEHSVDSVSQSANSLIEFTDRLLRAAFSNEEVLEWCRANYPDTPDLIYLHHDDERPTKRGQALCLLHGGQEVEKPSPIHLLAAASIHSIRQKLQRLKHSDLGTRQEELEVEDCLQVIEGFVTIGLRFAWAALPAETLQDLRCRLDPPRETVVEGEVVPGEAAG